MNNPANMNMMNTRVNITVNNQMLKHHLWIHNCTTTISLGLRKCVNKQRQVWNASVHLLNNVRNVHYVWKAMAVNRG